MGMSKRYTIERNGKTPKEVKGTLHDYGSTAGETFLQTEYRPSRSF